MGIDRHEGDQRAGTRGSKKGYKPRPGGFVALEYILLESPGYAAASASARRLLIDMTKLCAGCRNGAIPVTLSVMRHEFGWTSNDTLRRALRCLMDCGIVVETRKGGRESPSWYALTWMPLHVKDQLDIDPRHYRRDLFLHPPKARAAVNRERIAKAADALKRKRQSLRSVSRLTA